MAEMKQVDWCCHLTTVDNGASSSIVHDSAQSCISLGNNLCIMAKMTMINENGRTELSWLVLPTNNNGAQMSSHKPHLCRRGPLSPAAPLCLSSHWGGRDTSWDSHPCLQQPILSIQQPIQIIQQPIQIIQQPILSIQQPKLSIQQPIQIIQHTIQWKLKREVCWCDINENSTLMRQDPGNL